MENNNGKWYEQQSVPGAQSAPGGAAPQGAYDSAAYDAKRNHGREKKRFGWAQLIGAMLVVALIAGAAGAGIVTLAQGQRIEAPAQGAQGAGESTPGGEAGKTPVQTPAGVKASEGIAMGGVREGENTAAEMLRRSMSSVVGIDIIGQVAAGSYWYGGSDSATQTIGSGSGVILTANGYIATNAHVVSELGANGSIKVYLQDGTAHDAVLVGVDDVTDLAVIKIEAEGLPAVVVGASGNAVVGDTVYAIGNPLGVFASSVTDGIISGLDRLVEMENGGMTLMQTNAAVNPGNSGGGLFNAAGELIGIVNAKATGANVEGIGFAIPIDSALPILRDLMDLGFVSGRPYLGITPVDVYMTASSGGFGFSRYVTRVQVRAVEAGSAAAAAGVRENDVILALDGREVEGAAALSAILYGYKVGDTVTLTVLRDRQQIELSVTLGARGAGR